MDQETFNRWVGGRLTFCASILFSKNKGYNRNNDILHNFKQAAALSNCTPEQALWGMWIKHIISVRDIVEDTEKGIFPSQKILDDKIVDMINYPLLLEALLVERRMSK